MAHKMISVPNDKVDVWEKFQVWCRQRGFSMSEAIMLLISKQVEGMKKHEQD